ncbi:MAG: A/G-specific adenine glycosylase [Clostridia bacterium]|nr:A/G-specific adenine glycosylase [Clostridia bacterium]
MDNRSKEIGIKILDWYLRNKRDLPWRRTEDPYKIWISEIMLQQTRVDTVIDYYQRFIAAFPNVGALANAEEEAVLNHWKGLGYYRRARNLHLAAKVIKEQWKGIFPDSLENIRKLPGVGDYTAGAILSIAFNQPAAAVDGNVLRVLTRIEEIREDIALLKVKKEVEKKVHEVLPQGSARDFSQALMELGAMVCTPQTPCCTECPVAHLCRANARGLQEKIPVKRKKGPSPQYGWWVAWIEKHNKILMEYRKEETLLAKMWGFPMVKKDGNRGPEELFREKYGLKLFKEKELGEAEHIFTHQTWKMDAGVYTLKEDKAVPETLIWKDAEELQNLAIPTVFQKVVKLKGSK